MSSRRCGEVGFSAWILKLFKISNKVTACVKELGSGWDYGFNI